MFIPGRIAGTLLGGMAGAKRLGIWATQNFDKVAMGALLGSAGMGLTRSNQTTVGSTARTALYGGLGAGVGALGGAARNMMRSGASWTGLRSPAGFRGAVVGGLVGLGFGALKAGMGSNKPRNPIRGLY